MRGLVTLWVASCGGMFAAPAVAGMDFLTIGAEGNRAYSGPDPFGRVIGRGSVNYAYKIGRDEVTSGEWAEFFDAALNRTDPIPWVQGPTHTGGATNPMLPTGGISWHTAAIYCNWLHNGKGTDRAAFMDGAYDVSTFGYNGGPHGEPVMTDQFAHSAGARFWIPTLDEWLKAAHYNPLTDTWSQWSHGRDTIPNYGPPPDFPHGDPAYEANANFRLEDREEFLIPLGAYSSITSPWGLLDTAGATSEWLQEVVYVDGLPVARATKGSAWATSGGDRIYGFGGGTGDTLDFAFGLRIAAAVPSPGGSALLLISGAVNSCFRRRRKPDAQPESKSVGFGACAGGSGPTTA